MATRKNTASKTVSLPSATQTKARAGRAVRGAKRAVSEAVGHTRRGSRGGFDFTNLVAPGAAVLASGALAAAGYAFKEQIGDILVDVLKTATKQGTKAAVVTSKAMDAARDQAMDTVEKVSDKVSLDSFLRYAGLQRRSSVMSVVGPAIGVACGFLAGSALTYFFGPKLLEQLKDKNLPANDTDVKEEGTEDSETAQSSSGTTERANVNGGFHRGIS